MKYFLIVVAFLVAAASAGLVKRDATPTISEAVSKMQEDFKNMVKGLSGEESLSVIKKITENATSTIQEATHNMEKLMEKMAPQVKEAAQKTLEGVTQIGETLSKAGANMDVSQFTKKMQTTVEDLQKQATDIGNTPEFKAMKQDLSHALENILQSFSEVSKKAIEAAKPGN